MRRRVEHADVGVEDLLGAVAVVHVDVDYRDVGRAARLSAPHRDGGFVEQAEAHGVEARGVVARRTHHREDASRGVAEHGVGRGGCACGRGERDVV